MCKTYDAIFEIRKNVDSAYLVLWIDNLKIKGELHMCDEHKCKLKDVITLQNATTYCMKSGNEHHYKWLNIPSHWIRAFAFECCVID